jgi:hypothetical protein
MEDMSEFAKDPAMPFVIRFRTPVAAAAAEDEPYLNDCCIGGDVVLERLLPSLRETYGEVQPTQEDWGWFVWLEQDRVQLAVDVLTQNPITSEFEIRLTSRKASFFRPTRVIDTPELEALRARLVAQLESWPVAALTVERLDEKQLSAL